MFKYSIFLMINNDIGASKIQSTLNDIKTSHIVENLEQLNKICE